MKNRFLAIGIVVVFLSGLVAACPFVDNVSPTKERHVWATEEDKQRWVDFKFGKTVPQYLVINGSFIHSGHWTRAPAFQHSDVVGFNLLTKRWIVAPYGVTL